MWFICSAKLLHYSFSQQRLLPNESPWGVSVTMSLPGVGFRLLVIVRRPATVLATKARSIMELSSWNAPRSSGEKEDRCFLTPKTLCHGLSACQAHIINTKFHSVYKCISLPELLQLSKSRWSERNSWSWVLCYFERGVAGVRRVFATVCLGRRLMTSV